MMIFKIAWRNLWRHKRRSLIVLSSIVVGVVILILNDAFGNGMINQMLENQIKQHVSHIQIHKKGFDDNKLVEKYIPDPKLVEDAIKECDFVKNYSKRIVLMGLINYASNSGGVNMVAVEPEKEKRITSIYSSMIRGKYLSGKLNEIVIGDRLAEKLEVDTGSHVILRLTDLNGFVSPESFTVVGIFKTGTAEFDKTQIFVPLKNAQGMLGLGDNVNEFAMLVNEPERFAEYEKVLEGKLNEDYEILTYPELLPFLYNYIQIYDEMMMIFYLIIGVAVIFGTINTMLMSVFERINEIGVLMSIGMKRMKIFNMIIQEALVLGLFGTVIGFVIGLAIYFPLAKSGIDLSVYAESLSSFGMSTVIIPELKFGILLKSFLVMPIVTVVGAIYPAIKAILLQPTDAVRHV